MSTLPKDNIQSEVKDLANGSYSPYLGEIIINDTRQPVIVFIFGKVGSKSVVESIHRLQNIPYSIYHVQTMAPKTIANAKKFAKDTGHPAFDKVMNFNEELSSFIYTNFGNFKWKVITLTRDPGAIALSSFFQFLDIGILRASLPELYDGEKLSADYQVFKDKFEKKFLPGNIRYLETWFHEEMKEVFKIDVFEKPFDHEKGYTIVPGENVEILIMRNEDLDRVFSKAIEEFLGLKDVKLVNSNVGNEKYYGNLYKFIKERLRLEKKTIDFLYGTKYANHFYNKSELKQFRKKWSRRSRLKDKHFLKYGLNPHNIFERLDIIRKKELQAPQI